ncbi:MAG: hypothetical protein IJK04_09310, partial [Kiritimatiellae bacterium]|nr:hypothetical protein [Kiritimatiellia bacterium]
MHEHCFLVAHHNLPGPSKCEGPRQFSSCADTDADGIADNVELMAGADPLDADEDGDGIPDGLTPAAYAANPLWAESEEDANLSVVLQSAIPSGASATLVVGGLALPLRNPSTYILTLPPGEYVPFRLLSRNAGTVDLAFGDPPAAPMMRGGGNASRDLPVWARDPMGVFKGAAEAGSGALAVPVVHLRDRRGLETETSECVHDTGYFVTRFYDFWAEPLQMGLTTGDLSLAGFVAEGPLSLSLSFEGWYPAEASGWASILPSRLCRGTAGAARSIHRCAGAENYHDCDPCGFAHSDQESCPEEYGCIEEENPPGDGSSGGDGQGRQNPPEYSCSFMLHVAWQDMDGNGVADKDDGYLVPGSETVEFTAIGSTAGECCCGLDTGPDPLTARLVSHSSNLRLWDASGALLGTGDSLRTFRIQATAPSPSFDGSTVRYEIVGPTNDVRSAMTIRVTAWDMWCTGLAFNHDTTTNSVDAINLRHGYATNQVIDYALPEWACSANHSASPSRSEPACWIAGTTPKVKGRFVVRPTDITNAVIGAWHLGPILSSAAASSVVFSNGVTHASGATNHADFATFPLSSPIPAKVSRSTFEWLGWYATELNGQSASGFIGITVPSVAYSILGAPVAPWVDGSLTNQNVWVSALDFVITNACEGATTETNALAKLTQFLFSGHGLEYDTTRGYPGFLDLLDSRFKLSDYLAEKTARSTST